MIMSETLKSNPALEDGYQAMANDEDREAEALEWAEATIGDVADEPRSLVDSLDDRRHHNGGHQ
jgi:hypothetical protein